MIGTTYYQNRQMQRATPGGSQQQQALTKFMPILFGFWGLIFPAGLVIYWTTTNLVQIGQQHFMLPRMERQGAAKASGDGAPERTKGPSSARGIRSTQQREPRPISGRPKPETRNRQQQGTSRSPDNPGSRGGARAGGPDGGSRKKRRKR